MIPAEMFGIQRWKIALCLFASIITFFKITNASLENQAYRGKVKGGWGAWSEWSGYAKGLCAGNQRVKTRGCTSPMPSSDGLYCDGDNAVRQSAPIDGGLSEWTQWSTCKEPCGGSTVHRNRSCTEPSPQDGGKPCSGTVQETKLECLTPCTDGKTDGKWSAWSTWTSCPSSCMEGGGAVIIRYRQCNSPPPMNNGAICPGMATDSTVACFNSCPRDGGFGSWTDWSECSATCGAGSKYRKRFCNNPEPSEKGKNCTGDFTDIKFCKVESCYNEIDGNWGTWSAYSTCTESKFCNKGTKKRKRTCSNPTPANGGLPCLGPDVDTRVCPTKAEGCVVFVPTPIPLIKTEPDEYIARECGGAVKYSVMGTKGTTIPKEVMSHLKFNSLAFEKGYFYMRQEEKGTVLKYCFDPHPSVTIEDVTKLIKTYDRIPPLTGQRKLSKNETILGFSIRVYNKTGFALKGYDFGLYSESQYQGGNNVTIHDVMFSYYSEGEQYGNLAKGKYKAFDPRLFDCTVFVNTSNDKSQQGMRCNTTEMKLRDFFNLLQLPSPIQPILDAFKSLSIWGFKFGPVEIAYEFTKKGHAPLRFSATKYIDTIPVHFEIIYVPKKPKAQIAFGFTFDKTSFGALIEKATSSNTSAGDFLNSIGIDVSVGIAYNPREKISVSELIRFQHEPLYSGMADSISKGFYIGAQLQLPTDCKGAKFCKICKKILGPKVKFRMEGIIQKGYYKVSAGFYNIRLTDNIEFHHMVLYAEVKHNSTNKKVTLGFRAEVRIPINDGKVISDGMVLSKELRLGGLVTYQLGSSDIVFKLYMAGMWRKAFGVSWFSLGNIQIGLTLTLGSPEPVTGFQFGARLDFGDNCLYERDYDEDGHCIETKAYFGIGKPSYLYASVSSITVGKIMRMVGSSASLPEPVKESGFPKGLRISFSPTGEIDLSEIGGPTIPEGVTFKGTLNLIGYELSADVACSPSMVSITADCDPISLGGDIMVSRNKSHPKVGPTFHMSYRKSAKGYFGMPHVKVYFEGYAKVFGIEASCFLNLTLEAFEIHVYGKVWNLIYADLHISASYDNSSIINSEFYVRVIVDLRGLTKKLEEVMEHVDKAFKEAQKTLKNAADKVKQEKEECKKKMTLKCSDCRTLKCKEAEENCKGFLNDAGKWIGGAVNAAGKWIAKTGRKIADGLAKVGNSIKKIFRGWRKRRDLEAKRDTDFDHHVRKRRFVSKLICEGLVGGSCKGVEELCHASCKAVEHIGKGLCNVLDLAVGALKLAEAVCGWVNAAIQFLGKIFKVHRIYFELGLGQRFAGGINVSADIDITLFGNRMQFGFNFDLQNVIKSITTASNNGLTRYKQGIKQNRTEPTMIVYDNPNPYSDFDLTGGFGIEAVQSAGEMRQGACLSVDSKSPGSKVIQVACNSDDIKQKWSFTLKGTLMNAYSSKCLDLQNRDGKYVIQKDCDENANSQLLECHVVTRTVKGRRSDLCMTTAEKISPKGPGSLGHLGSLKCIHTTSRNTLVIKSGCSQSDIQFLMNNDSQIIHKATGLCVRPFEGRAEDGAILELAGSGDCHKFAFTKRGSIQHVESRLCLQTKNREMVPDDNSVLQLGTLCDYVKRHTTKPRFGDSQMLFSFIPTNPYIKMERCADFYALRIDQRFEVANDELSNVCSKFAKDIALHKPASQSSTSLNGWASRAVDGNYKFHWSDKTCTHTKEELNPWWKVDLGKEYIVTDVTVINRGEYGERFKNAEVHVGNLENIGRNPICHDRIKHAFDGEAVRVQCNPPIPGRYVSVQLFGYGILTVCEVIVNSRVGGMADWCLIENGGCEQLCYNKCDRKTSCGCTEGYQLAYDGKKCLDINECLDNNGGCKTDTHAMCINYPGSYLCACERGFILKDNSKTECMDVDECGVGNGGCEQMCNNTIGGHLCECREGYERKPNDEYRCQDIDECQIENGKCNHKCVNFAGGYYCECQPGYRLRNDGKTCEEIYCNVLEKPSWGVVQPAICTTEFSNIKTGTKCNFDCFKGYELKAFDALVPLFNIVGCQISGLWDKGSPSCHPVKCPPILKPKHGGLTPPSCHTPVGTLRPEFGQRCVAYCKDGYRLKGPATKYCQADRTWSTTADVECVKVYDPPYITCPADITVTLPADKATYIIGGAYLEPQTSINIISVTPVGAGPRYPFPSGVTAVKYVAVSRTGKYFTCQFYVTVKDVTKPKVHNCPTDIFKLTSNILEIVKWTEPTFTDAVGVTKITIPHIKNGVSWTVGKSVSLLYTASDAANNQAICKFTVTLKSAKCSPLKDNSEAVIEVEDPGKKYMVHCKNEKVLFGPFGLEGSAVICDKSGDYFIEEHNIGDRLPPCVGKELSTATDKCPAGSQKFKYEEFFEEKFYCALCPRGMHHNGTTGECEKCPKNHYGEEEGSTACEMCPVQQITMQEGSTTITDCLAKCPAGYHSANGYASSSNPCMPCPRNTYTDRDGSIFCYECKKGSITLNKGSNSSSMCLAEPRVLRIEPSDSIINVKVGEPIALHCYTTGDPSPTNKWEKIATPGGIPDGNFLTSEILNIEWEQVGISLSIQNATLAHTGSYKCIAENSSGIAKRIVQVDVTVDE